MKHILSLCIVLLAFTGIYAQHTIKLSIKNSEEKQPLAGATAIIKSTNKTAVAESAGIATFANLASGTFKVTVSYVGLADQEVSVTVPMLTEEPLEVLLQE